jgi:hypothetical protein
VNVRDFWQVYSDPLGDCKKVLIVLAKVAHEYDRLFGPPSWIIWVLFAAVLFSGNAWTDVFVFDATNGTSPIYD